MGCWAEGAADGWLFWRDADLAWHDEGSSSGAARKSAVLSVVAAGTVLPAAAAADIPTFLAAATAAAAVLDGPSTCARAAVDPIDIPGVDATVQEGFCCPGVYAGLGRGIDEFLLGEVRAAMEAAACAAAAAAAAIALPASLALAAADAGLLTDAAAAD